MPGIRRLGGRDLSGLGGLTMFGVAGFVRDLSVRRVGFMAHPLAIMQMRLDTQEPGKERV